MTLLRFPFREQTPILRLHFRERPYRKRHRQGRQNGFSAGDSENLSLLHIYISESVFGSLSAVTLVAGLVDGLRWFWLLSAFSQVTV